MLPLIAATIASAGTGTGTGIDVAMVRLIWKHTPRDAVLLRNRTNVGIYIGVMLTASRLPAIVVCNVHVHVVSTSTFGSTTLTVNIGGRRASIIGTLLRIGVGIGAHRGA